MNQKQELEISQAQITKKQQEITTQLANSDQHIAHYQEMIKTDHYNSQWYNWEIERELDYKKHLNYQLESLKKLSTKHPEYN